MLWHYANCHRHRTRSLILVQEELSTNTAVKVLAGTRKRECLFAILLKRPHIPDYITMTQNLILNTTWEDSNFLSLQENPLTHQNITYVDFYLHKPSVAASSPSPTCSSSCKNMRTVTNLFILNLAISDLLVGIFCMPTTLVDNIITGWPFGSVVCKLSGMVQGISVSASVFTLVAIAVDRFRCIVYPFKQKLTIATSKLIIVIIWVLAVSIMCPSGVMLQVTKEQRVRIVLGRNNDTRPFYWCRENWPNQEMRKIYTTVLFQHLPRSSQPHCHHVRPHRLHPLQDHHSHDEGQRDCVSGRHWQQQQVEHGEPSHGFQEEDSGDNDALIVALLFILSWLPLWTLMMLSDYASLTEHQYRVINIYVYPLAHWLAFFNSSVNPIIYGFFNENFRRGFQAAFKFQLCSADIERQKTYSHRIRGHAVLPVQPVALNKSGSGNRSGLVGNGKCSCQEGGSRSGRSDMKEQDLIMEDLEKVSQI
ncbi:G-protein coupled receptor 74 [Collichthys lucidus]|uniref:G-protein coupled receptor 74 n=1 Tax=Collichthys lucidus TaxID=240159 RepID=A0A4U5VB67_COLLU|nr:G-protein coupled receptor 74 [Collichthys lucidus]